MAYTKLSDRARELSSYTVPVAFTDEDDTALTPDASTIFWTLTTYDGTVINSRDSMSIASASTIYITLSGDDLEISDASDLERILTVECTYTSSYGTNLPLKDEVHFFIDDLLAIE